MCEPAGPSLAISWCCCSTVRELWAERSWHSQVRDCSIDPARRSPWRRMVAAAATVRRPRDAHVPLFNATLAAATPSSNQHREEVLDADVAILPLRVTPPPHHHPTPTPHVCTCARQTSLADINFFCSQIWSRPLLVSCEQPRLRVCNPN